MQNTTNLPMRNNQQSNGFANKYSRGYSLQSSNGDLFPLLALPQDFNVFNWSGVTVMVGNETVSALKIDEVLTEYCNAALPIRFTVEFVKLVNRQFFSFDFPGGSGKLDFAVGLYTAICNLPLMTDDSEIRKTLSLYLDNPFDLNLTFNSGS